MLSRLRKDASRFFVCWRNFVANRRGTVFAETAVLMPILLVVLLSGLEVGRFALLQQKLSRTAMTMSDLIAMTKTTISLTQVDNLYDAAAYIVVPFDLAPNGVVIVTAVTHDGVAPVINWQCTGAGALVAASEIGTSGATAVLPAGFTMTDGEIAIFAEVVYSYQPFVAPNLFGTTTLRHRAVFRPRTGALSVLLPGPVSAGAPTCT